MSFEKRHQKTSGNITNLEKEQITEHKHHHSRSFRTSPNSLYVWSVTEDRHPFGCSFI